MDKVNEDTKSYEQEALGVFLVAPTPPPPVAAIIMGKFMMTLGVKELKDKLKLRGYAISGNK